MKKNKIFKIIMIIISMLLIIGGSLFLSYSLILFNNLEKFYIIMGIIIILYLMTIFIFSMFKNFKHNRPKRFFISILLTILFSIAFAVGGYYIYNTYVKINTFNKDEITYSTSLVTFNSKLSKLSSVKKKKIGIVNDKNDTELYVLPNEYIEKKKLDDNNEIVKYGSIIDLMNALYAEEVDLIFVNSNYTDVFYGLSEYSNLDEIIVVDTYSKKIKKEVVEDDITTSSNKKLTEPFTILLLGIDSADDGLDKNAAFNGDTIMLITFNPETLNATMFSVPRDTYVKIACGNRQMQKINTSAYGGSTCVIKTLQNMTGITIDYYAKINFKGVVDLVDALGGIDVTVPYKFCEQNSNREFGSSTIYLNKGFQTLNGEQALALARNRKGHSEYCSSEWNTDGIRNDFVRGQNQQLVVEGMLNKVKTIRSANALLEVLDAISKNIDTNLTTDQILSFYDVVKNVLSYGDLNIINIQKTLLTGYDMYVYENGGNRYAFFNYKGSLNDIVSLMKENLGLTSVSSIKEFSYSANEAYEKSIIGKGTYKESKYTLVPNFSSYAISEIKSWGSKNDVEIKLLDNTTEKEVSDYSNYTFSSQDVHEGTLVAKVSSINIYLKAKAKEIKKEEEIEIGSTTQEETNTDSEN